MSIGPREPGIVRAGPAARSLMSWGASTRVDRMTSFKAIRARAEKRKGGAKALERLLPEKPGAKALAKISDDRILAEMTKRVFSAGFAWSVIEAKWEGFEVAFLGFQPAKLSFQPEDFWEGLMRDARIVRNGAK